MVSRSELVDLLSTLFAAIAVTIFIEILFKQNVLRIICVIALLCCLSALVWRVVRFKDREIQKGQKMNETVWAIYDKQNPIDDLKGLWVKRSSTMNKSDLVKTLKGISRRWEQETTISQDVGSITTENVETRAHEMLSEAARQDALQWLQHKRKDDLMANATKT